MEDETLFFRQMTPLLQVFDMPESLKFYRDLLGFSIVESSGGRDDADWVLLRKDSVELMLNTAYESQNRPSRPEPARIASHSDTSLYFGCRDVDAAYRFLHEKGVQVKRPEITGYGWKALTVVDPDGYLLCFQWPPEENDAQRE